MTAAAVIATDSDWQKADTELESTPLPPFNSDSESPRHILAETRIPRQGPGISSAGSPLYPGQPVIYGPRGIALRHLSGSARAPPGPCRPGAAATVTTPRRVGAAAAVGLHYTTFSRLRVSIYMWSCYYNYQP